MNYYAIIVIHTSIKFHGFISKYLRLIINFLYVLYVSVKNKEIILIILNYSNLHNELLIHSSNLDPYATNF